MCVETAAGVKADHDSKDCEVFEFAPNRGKEVGVECQACLADVTIHAYCAGHEGAPGCPKKTQEPA